MKTVDAMQMRAALMRASERVIENEAYLTTLDCQIGDGDHGEGMKSGFTHLNKMLHEQEFSRIDDLFRETGIELVKSMGGASGVIFGTLFIGGYDEIAGMKVLGADALIAFFTKSAESISRRGRTVAGDKTMLDALLYAIAAMRSARLQSDELEEILHAAHLGALKGVEATCAMQPRRGRAKNFREKAIGIPDPGAVSTAIIFQGLAEGLKDKNNQKTQGDKDGYL